MMTGRQPRFYCEKYSCCHMTSCFLGGCLQHAAADEDCSCAKGGCQHVPRDQQCTHQYHLHERPRHPDCREPTINTDNYLALAQYSVGLRRVVRDLLAFHPCSKTQIAKVLPLTKLVMDYYWHWKAGTDEGMQYRDVEDDMMARYAEMERGAGLD